MRQASELVTYIITQLTGDTDSFTIDSSIDENGVLLVLGVDKSQAGLVIGRDGSHAQSIRMLLRALGTKNNAKYNLKIEVTGE